MVASHLQKEIDYGSIEPFTKKRAAMQPNAVLRHFEINVVCALCARCTVWQQIFLSIFDRIRTQPTFKLISVFALD